MKLLVSMYRDEDGWFVVECPEISGCATQGRTEEEALTNLREAIEGCLLARRDAGLPLTVSLTEIEVPLPA